jgi:glycosyltransferase involved in cell wall biosynthesis
VRVLHLIDSGGVYGAEVMLLSLVAAQRAAGIDAQIGSLGDRGEGERPLEAECARRGIPCRKIRFNPAINVLAAAKILKGFEAEGVDLLHTHGYKADILFGMLLYPVRRIPIIATAHGWSETRWCTKVALYQTLQRLSWRWIERVAAVADNSPAYRAQLRQDHVVTIENGINLDAAPSAVTNSELRRRIMLYCKGRPAIGIVGRLSHEKGVDVLLSALHQLRSSGDECAVVVVGEGPERGRLEDFVAKNGLHDQVLFVGYVEGAGSLMSCFDLLVMPSRTEGLPITLLEAMAANVPVIASRVGQIGRVLEEGKCGLLIAPEDAGALAAGIRRLLQDNAYRESLATRARVRVTDNYSMSKTAGEYTSQYDELLCMKA